MDVVTRHPASPSPRCSRPDQSGRHHAQPRHSTEVWTGRLRRLPRLWRTELHTSPPGLPGVPGAAAAAMGPTTGDGGDPRRQRRHHLELGSTCRRWAGSPQTRPKLSEKKCCARAEHSFRSALKARGRMCPWSTVLLSVHMYICVVYAIKSSREPELLLTRKHETMT